MGNEIYNLAIKKNDEAFPLEQVNFSYKRLASNLHN